MARAYWEFEAFRAFNIPEHRKKQSINLQKAVSKSFSDELADSQGGLSESTGKYSDYLGKQKGCDDSKANVEPPSPVLNLVPLFQVLIG